MYEAAKKEKKETVMDSLLKSININILRIALSSCIKDYYKQGSELFELSGKIKDADMTGPEIELTEKAKQAKHIRDKISQAIWEGEDIKDIEIPGWLEEKLRIEIKIAVTTVFKNALDMKSYYT